MTTRRAFLCCLQLEQLLGELSAQIMASKDEWKPREAALLAMQAAVRECTDTASFTADLWRNLKEPIVYTVRCLLPSMLVTQFCLYKLTTYIFAYDRSLICAQAW
jgi:hypothetical protein